MAGFEELKNAYDVIKNEYGYLCKSISLPCEDNEYTKFVFEYQGFPIKHSFSYLLYESPYGENDDVEFFDSENDVSFTVSQLFAITGFVKIIQDNRDNKDVMNAFVEYIMDQTPMIKDLEIAKRILSNLNTPLDGMMRTHIGQTISKAIDALKNGYNMV